MSQSEHSKLSRITLITTYGDYFSEFSLIVLFYKAINDGFFAGLAGVGVGSAAAVVAGLLIPYWLVRFGSKATIVSAQLFSALVVILLFKSVWHESQVAPGLYVLVLFLVTFSSEWFKAARESHSHFFTEQLNEHRTAQSHILSGFYQAQLLGPLSAFIFLKFFPTYAAIAIDILSFLLAATLAMQLKSAPSVQIEQRSILQPLRTVFGNAKILEIFLLRTFGFWIPTAVFNVLIFQSAVRPASGGMEYSALWYAVMGMGGIVGTVLIRNSGIFSRKTNSEVVVFANLGFLISCVAMSLVTNMFFFIPVYLCYGAFMGLNASASQAWRRSVTTTQQLPDLIGLEIVVGLGLQMIVAIGYTGLAHHLPHPGSYGYLFSAVVYGITAVVAKLWKTTV